MKILLNPLNANIHVKACPATGETYKYAVKPQAIERAIQIRGRPFRSVNARRRGAWPCSARAWRVRVAPYMEELATERTAIITTAFMTESRPWIPADLMAMMKGEALESTSLRPMSSTLR